MSHVLANIQSAWDVAKPFQIEDAEFAARNGSHVLGHKTGLGKTFIALLAWSRWATANKGLVCGTLASCATWSRLLRQWGGVQPVFLRGGGDPGWREFLAVKEGVYMCTYATYLYFMREYWKTHKYGKPRCDVLINDELHRMMRTRNKTWEAFKQLDVDHYLGLSATWASRGPQDLYPVLNLVHPKMFPSYWRFVNTWCYVDKTQFGTDIYGVRNEANLRAMLWDRYYRARTWTEVGGQFRAVAGEPIVRRQELVDMSKKQVDVIRELDREMVATLGDQMLVTPNSLALLTRKLQLAISPRILFPTSTEYGGPVEWLAEKIGDDPHAVVFCPFREGLEVVRDVLVRDGRPVDDIFFFRGGMSPDETLETIARWKQRKGVALCTVAFAQSFELDTTDNAYMLGFSWDPNDNEQAEGRLRRMDSILQSPCNVTYIVPKFSDYEQVVMDVVNGKIRDTRDYLHGYNKNYLSRINVEDLPLA